MKEVPMADVFLFDTTLRDGTQSEGLSLSVEDKLKIATLLDGFGIHYIEGGWPASNPKDSEFFRRAKALKLRQAKLTAFGSTRKAGVRPEDDPNLRALIEAETPAVAIFGKSWRLHVEKVLETTAEENLAMIADSVAFLKRSGREVVYDAEHFFDGYRADPAYALSTVEVAAKAGADWIVLCDTNGGSLPAWVAKVVGEVRARVETPLGAHTHNDGEMAVANALAAVEAGCTQVQGTINGYGERCGNANLVSIIPALQLKMGRRCVPAESLARLTELSRFVSEIANLNPDAHAPYVGASAFAHKGGVHVAAVEKIAESYEHVPPELVGNRRHAVVSELSGRGNVRVRADALGLDARGQEKEVVARVKELENQGYQFEAAEGSFELLVRRSRKGYEPPFEVLAVVVTAARRDGRPMLSEATVKLRVGGETVHTAAEGTGPVHALDRALRKALVPHYPRLAEVRLADYKVRILDPAAATGARTRVLIEAAQGEERWSTIGVSENIIEASGQALADSFELKLLRDAVPANGPESHAQAALRS
ncbi:MAG TPA: citramalate synthase [Vicinamibacteria bacterium]|nr:citramalate synthase [Vicinamibacteria bacterium]